MSQRNGEIRFPWKPFAGAYMAPVPEVAPNSAITLADQIPAHLLEGIPADQRQAYIDQWPLLNQSERLIVLQTYGGASMDTIPPEVAANIPAAERLVYARDWPRLNQYERQVVIQTFSGQTDQIPADVLANIPAAERPAYQRDWPSLNLSERQILLQTFSRPQDTIPAAVLANIPASERDAYSRDWNLLSAAERQVLVQTFSTPKPASTQPTIMDTIPAAVLANIPAAERAEYQRAWPLMNASERQILINSFSTPQNGAPMQAGIGGTNWLPIAGLAFVAWWLFRKK